MLVLQGLLPCCSLAFSRTLLGARKSGRKRSEVAFGEVDFACSLKNVRLCGSDLVCLAAGNRISPDLTEPGTGLHIYFLLEPMQFLIIPLLTI